MIWLFRSRGSSLYSAATVPCWRRKCIYRIEESEKNLACSYVEGIRLKSCLSCICFQAPEIICGKPYDGRADLWSIATIVYVCLHGRTPFMVSLSWPCTVKLFCKERRGNKQIFGKPTMGHWGSVPLGVNCAISPLLWWWYKFLDASLCRQLQTSFFFLSLWWDKCLALNVFCYRPPRHRHLCCSLSCTRKLHDWKRSERSFCSFALFFF